MNVYFFSMNIPLCSWSLRCWFILFPSQAIDILSKGTLSTDVKSMRMKSFDRCIKNEMEEDIQKVQKKMQEDFIDPQQQARVIPSIIQSKLIVIFSVYSK